MKSINLIAISGSGRTGSTLLSLLLTQQPGTFNLGQIRDLWRAYIRNAPCSCDYSLKHCPVYAKAIPILFGANPEAAVSEMHDLMRNFFTDAASLRDWADAGQMALLRKNHGNFLSKLRQFLQIVSETTHCDTLVDASKSPEMALAFCLLENTETYVINLVRDPRAVACSWHKRDKKLRSTIRSCKSWADRQRRLESWGPSLREHFTQIKYETLTAQPRDCIEKTIAWAGGSVPDHLFIDSANLQISWDNQHLYPPANESVLARRETNVHIAPADSWRHFSNWPIHLIALLYTLPQGLRYVRDKDRQR